MLPTIALVGRPNVGKSTLFNRLTRSRSALVADFPGLTRDRQYGQGRVGERAFVVIDTGGFEPVAKEGILKEMARQTLQALDEADIVIFLVDGRAGVTPQDARIADLLRRRGRAVYLAVNKTEGMNDARVTAEFYELGIGDPYAISAAHGDRVNALIEMALEEKAPLPPAEAADADDAFEDAPAPKAKADPKAVAQAARDAKGGKGGKVAKGSKTPKSTKPPVAEPEQAAAGSDDQGPDGEIDEPPPEFIPEPPKLIKIAIVGHPNVGKSTLVNALLGEERVIAFDQPGTTRDSIYLDFTYKDREYTLIDTAGVRKRGKVTETVEKFSVIKTLQAIEDAHVVVFMVDATEGVSDHDVQLASFIQDAGRALVVCLNKWDVADADMRKKVNEDCIRKLYFVDYAEMLTISARTRLGLDKVMTAANRAHEAAFRKLPTPKLTRALQEAIVKQQPPRAGTIRPKMRYAHQGGSNPPIVVIHGTSLNRISDTYKRYLERFFLEYFELQGTPLRLELRTGHNPYADAGQSGRRKR